MFINLKNGLDKMQSPNKPDTETAIALLVSMGCENKPELTKVLASTDTENANVEFTVNGVVLDIENIANQVMEIIEKEVVLEKQLIEKRE